MPLGPWARNDLTASLGLEEGGEQDHQDQELSWPASPSPATP